MYSKDFIDSLLQTNLEKLKQIPKTDIHNHATRGGNAQTVLDGKVKDIPKCPENFTNLSDMQRWYDTNIKPHCQGKEGFERRIRGAFLQAKEDGVTHLVLSFGLGDSIHYKGNYYDFTQSILRLKQEVYPELLFYPEMSFSRSENVTDILNMLEEVLQLNFFISVDLTGDDSEPVDPFIPVYRKCREQGLQLKAHVGEFGDAETVKEAVLKLDLDEVHHGINAVNSIEVMNLLRSRQTVLNICPTSNIVLNRVKDYKNHPIQKLYRYGIPVTINTDDMLIFNQSVSEEYMELYKNDVLSEHELNDIRLFSISNIVKNRSI